MRVYTAVYTAVNGPSGRVRDRVRAVSDRVDGRVQGRGPCIRLVRSVLLPFSLQKTPFMPKRTVTNPLHSKRAPSAALRRTTVLRTILYIILPSVGLYALTLYPARADCPAATDISYTGCWQLSR